jgi:hypothetical protein
LRVVVTLCGWGGDADKPPLLPLLLPLIVLLPPLLVLVLVLLLLVL